MSSTIAAAPALPAGGYERAPAAPPSFHHALVVRFGRIGDLLMLTPALRALRAAVPGAAIEILTTPVGAATLATNPHVDARHGLRWRRIPRVVNPEKIRLVRRLRSLGPDAVFLFERAPRYHALVRALGVAHIYSLAPWRRTPGPGQTGTPLVGLHPGHFERRRRWRRKPHPKTWPPERYSEVVRRLTRRGAARFILTGAADEAPLVDRVARELPPDRIVHLAGKTDLPTLGAVLRRCALFIAPDTGPAHVAAAVGTRLVALFSRFPPELTGPMGPPDRVQLLYREPLDLPAHRGRYYHPRMYAITVEDVMDAVDRLDVRLA